MHTRRRGHGAQRADAVRVVDDVVERRSHRRREAVDGVARCATHVWLRHVRGSASSERSRREAGGGRWCALKTTKTTKQTRLLDDRTLHFSDVFLAPKNPHNGSFVCTYTRIYPIGLQYGGSLLFKKVKCIQFYTLVHMARESYENMTGHVPCICIVISSPICSRK